MVSDGGGQVSRIASWRKAPPPAALFFLNAEIQVRPSRWMVVDNDTEPAFNPGVPHALFAGRYQPYLIASFAIVHSYSVSPDSQRFLMIKQPPPSEPPVINVVVNWFEALKARARSPGDLGQLFSVAVRITAVKWEAVFGTIPAWIGGQMNDRQSAHPEYPIERRVRPGQSSAHPGLVVDYSANVDAQQ